MPAHSSTAGSMICQEAFAKGKMMESASWNGLLRDRITPSDIDLCFDNNGSIIFCDFSSSYDCWESALTGQRRLYQALIKTGPHCAALCKHNVTPEMEKKIDTLHDVAQFHVMVWQRGLFLSPIYHGSDRWRQFVRQWVNKSDGPSRIRNHILIGAQARRPVP